jgi:hypothetical protein
MDNEQITVIDLIIETHIGLQQRFMSRMINLK